MARFSTAFTPDQCWDSGKRPGEDCVTISVNLTKDFGLTKRVGWGGWACGGPGRGGGDTQTRPLRPPPFLMMCWGGGTLCVTRTLFFATRIS